MERDDLKKQAKVVDMMLTMHSILARRYQILAMVLEILLAGASTVLVALTFADAGVLAFFGMTTEAGRIILGVCSILVFFLSIVSLIVNWKGMASQHKEAFDTLVRQKAEWRDLLTNYDAYDVQQRAEFSRRSALVIGNLIPIPDSQFNRLKASHHKKVVLSKAISAHPGASYRALRWRLLVRGILHAFRAELPDDRGTE